MDVYSSEDAKKDLLDYATCNHEYLQKELQRLVPLLRQQFKSGIKTPQLEIVSPTYADALISKFDTMGFRCTYKTTYDGQRDEVIRYIMTFTIK